jgi:hypothetical protein
MAVVIQSLTSVMIAVTFVMLTVTLVMANRAEAKWAPQGGAGASGGLQGKEYDQVRKHRA